MDAYLAVTCHFVEENEKLSSVLLGVQAFPQSDTAENIACVKASLMEEWGISGKVTCMVTDGAPNMVACVRELKLRHHICVAHTLNLVKRALHQHPVLSGLRAKARKLVGYFRSSTTAKLTQVQLQLGMQATKLMQEVKTRWNSTYLMLQRLVELREPSSLQKTRVGIKSIPPPEDDRESPSGERHKVGTSSSSGNRRAARQTAQGEAAHAPVNEHLVAGYTPGPTI
ncbi:zinc finger BED domain-containing protein 1-like [Fundulus heteroclitus]|uniref:zinc finger BED domain-containing protein 1-like n=1 Tax=Fundulus heteroclitus TaxID=8078 RepID=UPI00165C87A2|nr:zinc finger BED domain-containing protein 1-like [Fundulus heteroclitus]